MRRGRPWPQSGARTRRSIYLACDGGATPAQSAARLARRGAAITADDVQGFLDELVAEGLVYEESGKYLSLSTAQEPRADDALADDVPADDAPGGLIQLPARRAS